LRPTRAGTRLSPMNRTIFPWTLAVVLVVACSATGGPRREQGGTKMTDASWQQILREWDRNPAWEVRITTGTEHFRKGLVTLVLRGDGSALVQNRRAGKDLPPFEGRIPAEQVRELGVRLAALDLAALPGGDRPRVPGDTPVLIEVRQGTRVQAQARCWHADRYETPALDRLLELADEVVATLSRGELPF